MGKLNQKQLKNDTGDNWPHLLRIRPKTVVLAIALWLFLAWSAFLVIDIFNLLSIGLDRPVWTLLFNDRPVEWTQWFVLALAAVAAGYLAGRLDAEGQKKAGRFFFLLGLGLGLMLIEDAGDIRHVLNREVERALGAQLLGVRSSFVVELPYFLALASVPVYAIARYGRYVWHSLKTRAYLIAGFVLYGLAAAGSAFSNLGHSYVILGGFIDIVLLGERLPTLTGRTQGFTYFLFVDSAVEESIELLAVTMLLAAILTFAYEFRHQLRRS